MLLVILFILPAAAAAAARNVLVVYSNSRLLPANVEIDHGLSEGFASRPEPKVEVSSEFLDAPKFSGEAYGRTFANYLREKYAKEVPNVIVVAGEEALDFVLLNRARLFPHVPVVHTAVPTDHLRSIPPLPPDVIGAPLRHDFVGTVELALRWHPTARHLVVVTGTSPWDLDWEARMRTEAAALGGRVSLEFLAGLPTDVLQKRLGSLGIDSLVFTPGCFRDGDRQIFVPRECVRMITAASTAPVYGAYNTFLGAGIVGARMANFVAMGRLAALTAEQLFAGVAPAAIAVPTTMPTNVYVDWRQVRRWGIPLQALPSDAIVQFKEATFWEAYWQGALLAVAVMLMQAALIAALLLERRRSRRTAGALAQSEHRMNLAVQAARLSMWIWDAGGGRESEAPHTPSRQSSESLVGRLDDFKQVLQGIYPPDRQAVESAVALAMAAGNELDIEYRIPGPAGELRWMAARGRVDQANGQRLLGVTLDITQRKRAELQAEQGRTTLRHMTRVSLLGQLSASIAHQLNQPLASILGNAEAAQKVLSREPVDLAELREICNDIVAEDHRAAEVIRQLGVLFKRGETVFVALDVNELVRDTLDLTRSNLLTRQVAVVTRMAPELPPVDGDRVQLQQLLLNLIVNAADAMAVTPEPERQVTISTEVRGSDVLVCVADRGPGIAAADAEKVFDPFWSTKTFGMGIGLAICRSIVAAHGGSLTLVDAPEGGAVFGAQFPARVSP